MLKKIIFYLIFLIQYENFSLCDENEENLNENFNYKPSFRIIAPKFLCRYKNDLDIPSPSEVTVSMQTREGQKLKYEIKIYFELLGPLKGQQHTISIWKSVRELQNKIKNQSDVISLNNQISIKNRELISGVYYVFEIIGLDNLNRMSDSQNFSITYNDGNLKSNIENSGTGRTDEVSLLMLGSDFVYGDIPIVIEAQSIWCTPNNDFYIKWFVTNLKNKEYEKYLKTKGKTLRIPSGILRGGETYIISAEILNYDNNPITKATMKMNVISKGYTAKISPEFSIIGINKNITIKLHLKDSDNTGEKFKISWECKRNPSEKCENFIQSNTDELEISFVKRGKYEITAYVSLNQKIKQLKSILEVNPDVIAYGNIINIPLNAISINDDFELDAIIEDLVPNCYAEWLVINEKGFQSFDVNLIPGGLGNITVRDIEEAFLSELIDYNNDTVFKNIRLYIPKKSNEWNGLKGNSKYKFRLNITCPAPYDDNDIGPRKNVTSFTDLIIETNSPPIGLPLNVNPINGESLRTLYKFSTGIANDSSNDYPLRYIFNYISDGITINIADIYEGYVATTDLPYSKSPILTFYQVCDTRNACSDYIYGPNITVTLNQNITNNEFVLKQKFIERNLENFELDAGFGATISCILTYKNLNNQNYLIKFKEFIIEIIKKTIKKLKNNEITIYSESDVIYFVKLSKQVLDILDVYDKEIFHDLLDLLDSLSPNKQRMLDLELIEKRFKRNSDIEFSNEKGNANENTKFRVKQSLELLEKLNLKNKELILDYIERYVRDYCADYIQGSSSKFPFKYDNKKLVSLEILKVDDRKYVIGTNFTIPFQNHQNKSIFRLNKLINIDLNSIYCIGKIFIQKNLNETADERVYDILIYRSERSTKEFQKIKIDENEMMERNIFYEIQIDNLNMENYWCGVKSEKDDDWNYKSCTRSFITSTYIQCLCNNFGKFKAAILNKTMIEMIGINKTSEIPMESISTSTVGSEVLLSTLSNNLITTISSLGTKLSSTEITTIPTITSTEKLQSPSINLISTKIIPAVTYEIITNTNTLNIETTTTTTSKSIISNEIIPEILSKNKTQTLENSSPIVNPLVNKNSTNLTNESLKIQNNSVINNINNTTSMNENEESNYGYATAFGILVGCAVFGIVAGIIYNRRKREPIVIQEMEISNTVFRNPVDGIRYARFHDEINMSGNFDDDPIS